MQQWPLSRGIVSAHYSCVDMSVPNPFGQRHAPVVKWSSALRHRGPRVGRTSGGTYAQQTLYDAVPDASLETHKLRTATTSAPTRVMKDGENERGTAPSAFRASGSKPTFAYGKMPPHHARTATIVTRRSATASASCGEV